MIEEYQAKVEAYFGAQVIADAKAHAVSEFPKESCGFIANGVYVPCANTNAKPEEEFTIDDARYDAALKDGSLQGVIHSHPNGTLIPSEMDMEQQIISDVPWAIINLNETGVHRMSAWGGKLPIAPVIGRPFLHGILDCYSLVRDVFRTGKDELLKQGVHWPFPSIELPEVARANDWWNGDQDLYVDHLSKVGFVQINKGEVQPGDGFLCAFGDTRQNPKKRLNHAGVILEHDMMLHHFPTRLSARSPAGIWARAADMWVRYEGSGK